MELTKRLEERLIHTSRVRNLRSNRQKMRELRGIDREICLERANQACNGLCVLPGTKGQLYPIGDLPEWHKNPTDDNEFLWSLNRMDWWTDLLRGFLLTGDSKYVLPVLSQLQNWVDECPCPQLLPENFDECTPWRSLETGLRMAVTWPPVLEHLVGTEFWNASLVELYARTARDHAQVLLQMCPPRWPEADHNHYLTEMAGLMTVALLFPELDSKKEWYETAYTEIVRCIRNQITDEGGHVEGCPGYHNHCVDRLLTVYTLLEDFGKSVPADSIERLKRAVAYTAHATRPSGTIVPWGDSDPNLSHIPILLRADQLGADAVPLAKLALQTVSSENIRRAIFERVEDISWDDLSAYAEGQKVGAVLSGKMSLSIQYSLKQLSYHSDWTPEGLHLFFGCMSPVHHGGHAHMDPMSFELSYAGNILLTDPGRYTYREVAARVEFKSATAHNTVTVNEGEPFSYRSSFGYGHQGFATLGPVLHTRDGLRFSAWQTNFSPVLHKRTIHIVENSWILVHDRFVWNSPASDSQSFSAQVYFHSPGTDGNIEQPRFGVVQFFNEHLFIHVQELHRSRSLESRILPGRISSGIDVAEPSQRLRCSVLSRDDELDMISVIVPRVSMKDVPIIEQSSKNLCQAITCTICENTHTIQLASGGFS